MRDGDDPGRRADGRPVLVDEQMQRVELAAAGRNAGRQRVAARIAEPAQGDLDAARPVRVVERAVRQVDPEPESIARHRRALDRFAAARGVLRSDSSAPEQRLLFLIEHAGRRPVVTGRLVGCDERCRRGKDTEEDTEADAGRQSWVHECLLARGQATGGTCTANGRHRQRRRGGAAARRESTAD